MIFSIRMFPFKENLVISAALVTLGFFIGICGYFWMETLIGSIFCVIIYIAGLWDFFVKTEYRFYADKVEKKSLFSSSFSITGYKRLEIYPNGIYFLKGKNSYFNRLRGVFIPVRNWDDVDRNSFDEFLDSVSDRLEVVRIKAG